MHIHTESLVCPGNPSCCMSGHRRPAQACSLLWSRALLRWLLQLVLLDAALWALYAGLAAVQPVSRRACNAAYAAWLLALNLLLLLALAGADALWSVLQCERSQARPTHVSV